MPDEPLVTTSDLLNTLASMFHIRLSDESVDMTGKNPKILLAAKAFYEISPDSGVGHKSGRIYDKDIFASISIPALAKVSVKAGIPMRYLTPAVKAANYSIEGGITDSASDIAFYNKVIGTTGCYGTAAAMQLAYYYVQAHVLPTCNLGGAVLELNPVANDNKSATNSGKITSYMANELSERHEPEVLTLLYHCIESTDVLSAAGYSTEKRVLNRCGDLPSATFTLDLFYEVYYILKHSLCGTGDTRQFDMDFVVTLCFMFSLHGTSDHGGIWRQIWRKIPVCPNSMVATSYMKPFAKNYGITRDSIFISASTMLQTIVSRVVVECASQGVDLLLPAGATTTMAAQTMGRLRKAILQGLSEGTGMAADYWHGKTFNESLSCHIDDRHLSDRNTNVLHDAGPYVASYALPAITSKRLGACSYTAESSEPVKFTGSYGVKRRIDQGVLLYERDMTKGIDFTDGLLYVDPKVNPSNGLSEMIVDCFETEEMKYHVSELPLVDGQVIRAGDVLGSKMWRDNGDILPCFGELLGTQGGKLLLSGSTVPSTVEAGKYTVSVSTYSTVLPVHGEDAVPGKTRRDMVNRSGGRTYSVLAGKTRCVAPTLSDFFSRWKREIPKRAAKIKRAIDEERKARKEWAAAEIGKPAKEVEMMGATELHELVDEVKESVDKIDVAHSALAKGLDGVTVGTATVFDDQLADAVSDALKVSDFNYFVVPKLAAFVDRDKHGNAKQARSIVYGLYDHSRPWDVVEFLDEAAQLRANVGRIYGAALDSSHQTASVLVSHAAAEDMWKELAQRHSTNWKWSVASEEEKIQRLESSFSPVATSARLVDEHLATTIGTEATEETSTPDV